MCRNCVRTGKMTEAEYQAQREEIGDVLSVLGSAADSDPLSAARAMLGVVLSQPAAAAEFVRDFCEQMEAAGWFMGIVRNGETGEYAFGWTRTLPGGVPDMGGPTIPQAMIDDESRKMLRENGF